jgi:glycosyltransferase involved in cell wall biosynthesis
MADSSAVANGTRPVAPEPAVLRAIADSWTDETIAAELRLLAQAWQDDCDRLRLAQDELRQSGRVSADVAAMQSDHLRNVSELMNALVATEIRLREALREAAAPRAGAPDSVAPSSPSRLARWFAAEKQRFRRRHPWLARQLRRFVLLIWWTLRGQIFRHLRYFVAHRRGAGQTPLAIAPPIADAVIEVPPAVPVVDDPWPADRPLVSVIIPCFNYGHFLKEAVDSVLNQTYQDLEVIIVEGGSSALESRYLLLGLRQPGVRVLLQGGSRRVGENRNLGIRHARGRYVCCLDADDKLQPTYIEKAVFLLERSGCDVVSSALRYFGGRDDLVPIIPRPNLSHMREANHVLTSAVFRRTFWEKAGGYQDMPPDGPGYVYEDWRLWVRMAALGARIINLPRDPMLLYRSHGPSLSKQAVPMDVQRKMVRILNADVLEPIAVARAARAAADERHVVPMAHLRRGIKADNGPSLLLALPFMILGGAEKLLSALVGHLTTAGWRVVVVTTMDPGPGHGDTFHWFEAHTKEIFRLPGSLPEQSWPEFLRYLLMSRRIDVLWVIGNAFVYQQLPAIRQAFPRLRIADLLFNTIGHTADNQKFRDCIDLNFVENEEVLHWLLADGETRERICLVRSGVDIHRLRPDGLQETRARIGAAPGDLVVGFSGRWSGEKDPLAFVAIARQVDPGLRVRFVMTGAGHLGPAIEQAIAAAGFHGGRFHLLGEVDDIVPWLNTYDLLVLPSRVDGRPVVVMEALAVGVPVLASRVGALPELVVDGETGWLLEPGDVAGFAARIEQIARAPATLPPMRMAARRYAEAHFDEQVMHASYEAHLRALTSA